MDRTPNRTKPETSLPLAEAALALGIAYDTARKRLHAGTLAGERRGGRWYVAVPKPDPDSGPIPDQTGTAPDPRDRLIAALEADVTFLREQLDHGRRELAAERERFDVLHREALGRIPALGAGETARSSPTGPLDSARPGPLREATRATETKPRPWRKVWRRLVGGASPR